MHLRHVDGDRHVVVEPEVERLARRERRDEVRPRGSDALTGALLLDGVLDAAGAAADRMRVDPEVAHRLRAERLDELDARLQGWEIRPRPREREVVAPDPEHGPTGVAPDPLIARERRVRERK